ncbi:SusC/RagA family TonB-linked outer membrane protein [Zunongwangia sp. HRR-M8]|uniref:SusC/RagA family TonB-linked outer membrane protein n=1 Tax=Zunongwangia sp. HRR-M8 TaxID=3015170 RepID=UPI0022DCE706|nr:TonB-dependent receptor [Zunongwangia sp. HRR-M8]WBL22771.1 TonB-dependent receptor [Zunongwangia sp. HRR-M8]
MFTFLLNLGKSKPNILFLFLIMGTSLFAQQKEITGEVLDESGLPLPGATVLIKGTSNGTVTNMDGEFSLEVKNPENAVLVVSFVSFQTKEIEIGEKDIFSITLLNDTESLNEVVVVGYGTKKRKDLTGAVSVIKSDEISRTTSTTTAGALAGKIQGVAVRAQDARPGRGARLEIRNMGSPLFVIDGVPYGGDSGRDWLQSTGNAGVNMFNSLNPEDIESISILKDASAAVYGMRAASGVVLVTTKKGRKGDKPKININSYYGWQNLTRFPELANAAQYTRGLVEAAQNEGRDPNAVYTPEELQKWQQGTEPGYQSYDYYDFLMRDNVPQYHLNASVAGGTDKTNYYLSIANTRQEALLDDFGYERTNLQVNIESQIAKRLTVGTQISGKLEETNDVGLPGGDGYYSAILGLFSNIPTTPPYANNNPEYPNHTRDYSRNPALFKRDIVGYKDNFVRNLNTNLYAEYKFDFGLKVRGTYSYNFSNNKFDGFQYSYDVFSYDEANDTYNPTGGTDSGWRYQTEREDISTFSQIKLDYAKKIGKHSFSIMGAYERNDFEQDYQQIGSNPSNRYLPLLQFDELNSFADYWSYQARVGYIGKLNYSYDDKYIVEILGRYDASFKYIEDYQWSFFPGVSLGWRISDEKFFEPLSDVVNDLKIRASTGQTGKEANIEMFDYLAGYTWKEGGAVLNNNYTTGLKPRGLPIRNLSWIKNKTSNIGIDLTMFDNKLSFTGDIFRIRRTGVPAGRYDVLLPSEIGYKLPPENLNENGYNGAEAILTYKGNINDFNYSVSGNFTYSRYKSISTYKPRFGNSYNEYRYSAENRWGGAWWGYQVIGQFESEEQIRNYDVNIDGQNNSTLLPGDLIYKDVNGDGVINGMDERPIGYARDWSPILSYGGTIAMNWKNIDLTIDLAGGSMQSWFQEYELRNPFHAGGNSPAYLLEDRWHRADPYDPESEWIPGRYPAVRNGNVGPNHRNSDFWLTNVWFLRLRNIELGYTFPKSIVSKINADKLRIYGTASNLVSFDNVNGFGIDPEISAGGGVVYPQQSTIVIGVNLSL